MRATLAIILIFFASGLITSCDNARRVHPDWDALVFPSGLTISSPIEIPGGTTGGYVMFAVGLGPPELNSQEATIAMKATLVQSGWQVFADGDARPGFMARAPETSDVAEVSSLRAMERFVKGYGGQVDQLIESAPHPARSILVRLSTAEDTED